jgi:uncharacterized membrane protein YcaP (DUF421 family)
MDLVIRATVVFLFIYLVTRAAGKRELSSMEPFDLILLVVMGDLVQQSITQSDYSVTGALIVISTITLLTVFVSWINWRFKRMRSMLEGQPVVLVEKGNLIEHNMKRERITPEDIESEARQQQVTDIADIRWALLETNGRISIIPDSK